MSFRTTENIFPKPGFVRVKDLGSESRGEFFEIYT
jgi:hypothetical protein